MARASQIRLARQGPACCILQSSNVHHIGPETWASKASGCSTSGSRWGKCAYWLTGPGLECSSSFSLVSQYFGNKIRNFLALYWAWGCTGASKQISSSWWNRAKPLMLAYGKTCVTFSLMHLAEGKSEGEGVDSLVLGAFLYFPQEAMAALHLFKSAMFPIFVYRTTTGVHKGKFESIIHFMPKDVWYPTSNHTNSQLKNL